MAKPKRFGKFQDEEIDEIVDNKDGDSTKKTIKRSVKIFR
jgi:hypothetical protein